MSDIKRIINYFFKHQFSDEIVDKVHQRLLNPDDSQEKENALRTVWEDIGYPIADNKSLKSFAQIERNLCFHPRYRMLNWMRVVAIWFVPFLFLCYSYYLYQDVKRPGEISFVERYVPAGKREQVILPDGSHVWLNSGTLLLYPSFFTRNSREIYLVGEGYFKVKELPEQPFIVKTQTMQVEVLGTEFNLSAYPDEEKITTTLQKGSIKILLNDKSLASYILKPNEQLVYIPSKGQINMRNVVAVHYSDWTEGGLLFNNDSFDVILKVLERIYNVKVHMRTSAYHSERLTIHFNKNESLENVLMLVKEMIPGLEYQIKDGGVYID